MRTYVDFGRVNRASVTSGDAEADLARRLRQGRVLDAFLAS
jgi:hypothetical protein